MYAKLSSVLRTRINLSVGLTDDARRKIKKDTLLILDEGDWYLLDKIGELPKNSYGIIALTATVVGIVNGNEMKWLNQLNFQMNDSKIPPNFDPALSLETISDEAFLSKERSQRAKLIWCTDE